jgi:formamidopyrimidine-DNA glycosylase
MPEVIEVRQYRDFIESKLLNAVLLNINILKGRYKTHGPFAGYEGLKAAIPATLTEVGSKGKFMWMRLSSGPIIIVTLGLSGGWFYQPANSKTATMLHGLDVYERDVVSKYIQSATNNINVEFIFDHGTLYFYDQLSFGTLGVFQSEEQLDAKLKTLGPDIMNPETTFEQFSNGLRRSAQKEIGTAIVNQKLISGIGNYLRADALWLSRISPFRKVKDITEEQMHSLFYNSRLMVWGLYNRKEGERLKIIKSSDKLPEDFGRQFFIYFQSTDIFGNPVLKEESYEGSQKRFIYWTPVLQI